MPLPDYNHHNEDARRVWWEEEGRWHGVIPPYDVEPDDEDDDLDYDPGEGRICSGCSNRYCDDCGTGCD